MFTKTRLKRRSRRWTASMLVFCLFVQVMWSNTIFAKGSEKHEEDKVMASFTSVLEGDKEVITISARAVAGNIEITGIGLPNGDFIESEEATYDSEKNGTYSFEVFYKETIAIKEPQNEVMDETELPGLGESQTVEDSLSDEESTSAEESQAAEETQPEEESQSTEESQPEEESQPAEETQSEEETQPEEESQPAEETQSEEETQPAAETQATEEIQPLDKPQSADELQHKEESLEANAKTAVKTDNILPQAFAVQTASSSDASDILVSHDSSIFKFNAKKIINLPDVTADFRVEYNQDDALYTISISAQAAGDHVEVREIVAPDGTAAEGDRLQFVTADEGEYDFEVRYTAEGSPGSEVFSYKLTSGRFSQESDFIFDEGSNTIIGYNPDAPKDVVIPEQINGVEVLNLGAQAFAGQALTSIHFPESLESIGNGALEDNPLLTSLTIPQNVSSIQSNAFANTPDLDEINILFKDKGGIQGQPWGADSTVIVNWRDAIEIYPWIFSSKTNEITKYTGVEPVVTVPATLEHNGAVYEVKGFTRSTFESNRVITDVTLLANINAIPDGAFWTSNLKSINMPDSLTSIGDAAFGYTGITTISIPKGVTRLEGTFQNCEKLISVDLPDGLTRIGNYTFQSCRNLSSIDIPKSVNVIGYSAFADMVKLTHINLQSGVNIWDRAFYNTGLTEITIPSNSTITGSNVFKNTPALTEIVITNAIERIHPNMKASMPWGAADDVTITFLGDLIKFESSLEVIPGEFARYIKIKAYNSKGIEKIRLPGGKIIPVTGPQWPESGDYYYFKMVNNGTELFLAYDSAGNEYSHSVGTSEIGQPTVTAKDATIFTKDAPGMNAASILALVEAKGTTVELGDDFSSGRLIISQEDVAKVQGLTTSGQSTEITVTAYRLGETDSVKVTVTAVSVSSAITVSFDTNGGKPVPADQRITSGEKIMKPSDPQKEGYTFDQWYRDAALTAPWNFDADRVGTDAVTLYAGYQIKTYSVKFVDWDHTPIGSAQTVEHGTSAAAPADPVRTGYTFTGWDKPFDSVTGNITVKAQYRQNPVTVSFETNGGEPVPADQRIASGEKIVKPSDPQKEGYTFDQWYRDAALTAPWNFDTDRVGTDAVTLYAGYQIKTYSVKFVDWDHTPIGSAQTVEHGTSAAAPADPVRTGYTFTGWDKPFDSVTGNLTVKAQYRQNPVMVSFETNGGEPVPADQRIASGEKIMKPSDPQKEGYTFDQWYRDAALTAPWNFDTDRVGTDAVTLYAGYQIKTYTVEFVDWEHTPIGSAQTVEHGTSAAAPADPVRTGYTFTGWDKPFDRVTGDMTIMPRYDKVSSGGGDAGDGDTGNGDTGNGDTGNGDTGSGDSGSGDTGSGDSGSGDTGSGDTGSGDTGSGNTGNGETSEPPSPLQPTEPSVNLSEIPVIPENLPVSTGNAVADAGNIQVLSLDSSEQSVNSFDQQIAPETEANGKVIITPESGTVLKMTSEEAVTDMDEKGPLKPDFGKENKQSNHMYWWIIWLILAVAITYIVLRLKKNKENADTFKG